jgi:hypothetical protein
VANMRGERCRRKSLFLLKYRGSTFHRRYYHDNAECYEADDWELLREYISEKGFKQPTEGWFDNLKTILELGMDPEGEWIKDLPKRMFSDNATWFITHAQRIYMAICTPSSLSDEFILKIDAWSQDFDESLRLRNPLLLIESYLPLPPCRVWLFVKQIRVAFLERSKGFGTEIDVSDCFQGPENIIAGGKYLLSTFFCKMY